MRCGSFRYKYSHYSLHNNKFPVDSTATHSQKGTLSPTLHTLPLSKRHSARDTYGHLSLITRRSDPEGSVGTLLAHESGSIIVHSLSLSLFPFKKLLCPYRGKAPQNMRMPVCAVLKLCRVVVRTSYVSRLEWCFAWSIESELDQRLLSCCFLALLCLDVMPLDLKEAARPGGRAWRSRRRAVVHHHRRSLWLAAGPVHVVADAADHEEGGATTASGSADDDAHA